MGDILGGAVGGAGAGASFGVPGIVIGGALGAGSAYLGRKKGGSSRTTKETRTSTPVRVRLPSGAVVTMYSHGPGSTTETVSGPDPNPLAIAGDVLTAGSMWKKYQGGEYGGSPGTSKQEGVADLGPAAPENPGPWARGYDAPYGTGVPDWILGQHRRP